MRGLLLFVLGFVIAGLCLYVIQITGDHIYGFIGLFSIMVGVIAGITDMVKHQETYVVGLKKRE
jgi:uncharacterized membrane protein HdeD (DUF308 family)